MKVDALKNNSGNLEQLASTEAAKTEKLRVQQNSDTTKDSSDKVEISDLGRIRSRLRVNQKNTAATNQADSQTVVADSAKTETNEVAKEDSGSIQISENAAKKKSELESQLQTKKSDIKRKEEKLRDMEQQAENKPGSEDDVQKLKNKVEQLKNEVKKVKSEINRAS